VGAGWWEVDYKWSAWGDEVVGVVDTGRVLALQPTGMPRQRTIRGNEGSLGEIIIEGIWRNNHDKNMAGAITNT
jgi:hypothetical protein